MTRDKRIRFEVIVENDILSSLSSTHGYNVQSEVAVIQDWSWQLTSHTFILNSKTSPVSMEIYLNDLNRDFKVGC